MNQATMCTNLDGLTATEPDTPPNLVESLEVHFYYMLYSFFAGCNT